ncbi:MAG: NRAMP family divalent metal transporter [Minisyncoccia bacterium]
MNEGPNSNTQTETFTITETITDTVTVTKSTGAIAEVEQYWETLGPGLTTGASDDDPSGIATYSQAGATYGFSLLWMSLFTFPLMAVVQEMCARIGLATGQGLAANIRTHYPKKILYTATFLLLIANIFNIGADLGAMAKGVQLVLPNASFALLVILFGVGGLLLQVFINYKTYAKYLKYLALVLFSYVATALFVHMDWVLVLKNTVVPHINFSKDQIFLICGILGTTISPYLFFWQTSQEVEEEILSPDPTLPRKHNLSDTEVKKMRTDVWSGMFISNVVMFFIIATTGATLFSQGITITTAADAAQALRPLAGNFAFILFAIGILGTGMLAIPVLAGSSAYAVSESMGWKFGLYRKLKEAYAFYGVIALATVVGIVLNFVGIDPIKALIYSAVLNGIIAPIVLYFIVKLSSNPEVMGNRANSKLVKFIGWLTIVLMGLTAVSVVVSFFL